MGKNQIVGIILVGLIITVSLVLRHYSFNAARQAKQHPDCVFCQIVAHKSPATYIRETDDLIVINNIAPKAPLHYLIIPKKHIVDLQSLEDNERSLAANMLFMARDLAKDLPGSQSFKLISNNGAKAGQSIFHIHVHFFSWEGHEGAKIF